MPTALLSVSDKSGLVDFAQSLAQLGWDFIASGGTAKVLVGDSKGGYLAIPRWNKDLDSDSIVLTVRKDFVGASFNGYRLGTSNEAGGSAGHVGVRTFNGQKAAIEKLDVNE